MVPRTRVDGSDCILCQPSAAHQFLWRVAGGLNVEHAGRFALTWRIYSSWPGNSLCLLLLAALNQRFCAVVVRPPPLHFRAVFYRDARRRSPLELWRNMVLHSALPLLAALRM